MEGRDADRRVFVIGPRWLEASMGKYDSSRTRISPVFTQLDQRDATGLSWLPALLSLPMHGRRESNVAPVGPIRATYWTATDGPGGLVRRREKALRAPESLLHWMIDNTDKLVQPENRADVGAHGLRQELFRGDAKRVTEAQDGVRSGERGRNWYVFEGPTFPDVYIETDELVVVIEGKRRESGPTTKTTWMKTRHQMLRHMDCAFDLLKGRSLVGFFIVEGEREESDAVDLPPKWKKYCEATTSEEAVAGSLPHRDEETRKAITKSFAGATTWQAVCGALNVSYAGLRVTVDG